MNENSKGLTLGYPRQVALLSAALWVIALFLPAYVYNAGILGSDTTGGEAFVLGFFMTAFLLEGGLSSFLLWLAWLSNIIYFVIIIALLLKKYSSRKIVVISILVAVLPAFAYLPGSISYAVVLWQMALLVAALLPISRQLRKYIRRPVINGASE